MAPQSLTLADLWHTLQARGRADFLVMPGRTLSYADMLALVRRWLARFDAMGLAQADRLVIRTGNEAAAVSAWIAALLDGLVPVMVTPQTPEERLAAIAGLAEATGLVSEGLRPETALPAGLLQAVLQPEGAAPRGLARLLRKPDPVPGLTDAQAQREPRLPADRDGLAYLLFTSGTTSSPAGVMVTRGNLLANLSTIGRVFGYDSGSRIFNDMILAHADGLIQGPLLALAKGCALIRSGGFALGTMEQWLNRVRQERATHVITVPTVWAMIDAYAAHDDYFDAPECTALLSVAAKLAPDLWDRLEARFKRPVFNQYGLTETVTSALYAGPQAEMGARHTIGKPIDCQARIADPGPDGAGELHLRGDNVFPGYWRNPERTAASFTDDGWLRTGDLCRIEADGSYAILGRLKTVIMTGGFLIRPDEIDEAMLRHPQVRESATMGIEDHLFGEVPITAVVCDGVVAYADLAAHARSLLEDQKVPRHLVVLEAIPRGISGKVQGDALRSAIRAAIHSAVPASPAAADGEAGANLAASVLAVAADVFRVDPALLTLESRQGDVAGWDSFSQINLIMAAEGHFAIAIPAARVAAIRTLGDLLRTVEDLRG